MEPAAGQHQPLSPVEELQERYRSAANEYPDPDGLAAAIRALADHVVPHEQPEPRRGMRPGGTGALTLDEAQGFQRAATRRKLLAIAAELEGADA